MESAIVAREGSTFSPSLSFCSSLSVHLCLFLSFAELMTFRSVLTASDGEDLKTIERRSITTQQWWRKHLGKSNGPAFESSRPSRALHPIPPLPPPLPDYLWLASLDPSTYTSPN